MKKKNFGPSTFLLLLASAVLFLPSCDLFKGEEWVDPKPLMGRWQLDRADYDLSFNEQDLVRYLIENNELTQVEAESIRTDLIDNSSLPFIRQITFNSDYETIRMKKGNSEDYVYGTFETENNNTILRIAEDESGQEWLFNIIEIGERNFAIESSDIFMHDLNGNGDNEKIDIRYIMEFGKG